MAAFLAGFLLCISLIVAIGAQNAFVLRQAIRGEHVFLVCLACALSDAVLISIGVAGFGTMVDAAPWVEPLLRYGGAAFLAAYGARSLWSAVQGTGALVAAAGPAGPVSSTLATCLAFTWLNPHVYLDTVVLMGSISTRYDGRLAAFAAGAIGASFAFFFALGYGGRVLRPVFARPEAWRLLDLTIGAVMWAIAFSLVWAG